MENGKYFRLIFFDMDGVLINKNHVIEISKIADVEKEMVDLLTNMKINEWGNGNIGLEWTIKKGVQLLKGTNLDSLIKVGKEIPLIKGARKTIKILKDNNYYPIIISNGLFPVCVEVGRRLGVNEIYANIPETDKKNRLTGDVYTLLPSQNRRDIEKNKILISKGVPIRKISKNKKISLKDCVSVGNDLNDFSMFENVGFSIFFGPPKSFYDLSNKFFENPNDKNVVSVDYNVSSDHLKLCRYVKLKLIVLKNDLAEILPYLIPEPAKMEIEGNEIKVSKNGHRIESKTFSLLREDKK